MKPVCITGMPLAGKSYWGKIIAAKLSLPCIDLDEIIESRIGISIAEYVQTHSWDNFRRLEQQELLGILKNRKDVVLSIGGGTLENPINRSALLKQSILVYLEVDISEIMNNVNEQELKKRPLFNNVRSEELGSFLRDLLVKRRSKYEQSHVITDLQSLQNLDLFTKRLHLFT